MTQLAQQTSQRPTREPELRLVHGWGRTAPTAAHVVAVDDADAVATELRRAPGRGVLARGLGRSYGDSAQNAGGLVLDLTPLDRVLDVDLATARVEVEAGISLDRLLRQLLPLGLTLPVQPGTRQVTVGGAVANDIHGKNHHVAGSVGDHVEALTLLTADGEAHRLTPDGPDAALFWGTVGGLGLTGVITQVALRLRRVETSRVVVRTERAPDLASVMARLRELDRTAEYSVAWFDSVTRGRGAGRGVVLSGRDAELADLTDSERADPLSLPGPRTLPAPYSPVSLVNRASGRVFDELWFRKAPRRPRVGTEHAFGFFQPLDGVAGWNRLYGPRGLAQYQLLVPDDAACVVEEAVRTIADSGHVSCLNVLKRFGPGNAGMMSFPAPGWTLAVDLPVRDGLAPLLDRLDAMVVGAGGRVYLAKDSRLQAGRVAQMYPRLAELRELLSRVDPDGVFASDLARRLHLREDA